MNILKGTTPKSELVKIIIDHSKKMNMRANAEYQNSQTHTPTHTHTQNNQSEVAVVETIAPPNMRWKAINIWNSDLFNNGSMGNCHTS